MNDPFLKPKFIGTRFSEHTMPLEMLKDLAVLEEMIVETAKRKYLEANPSRQRSPRGFTEDLSLHLQAIEPGSAVPVIAFCFASLFPPHNSELYTKARDSIIGAINAAEQGTPITDHLPAELLVYFDRFGRSLRDGEAIELPLAGGKTTKLTPKTRRTLILESGKIEEWTQEVLLRGCVSEVDQKKKSFQIELKSGASPLKAPLDGRYLQTVLDALVGYEDGIRVLLQAIAKKDRQDRLIAIESVEHISLLDPLDVQSRLETIAELENGWLDGKGLVPDKQELFWLGKQFDRFFDPDLPLPYIYPTAEGGVQAEWSIGDWEISLEVNLSNKVAEWQAINIKTEKLIEEEYNLQREEEWLTMNGVLKKIIVDGT